jgi:RNA polymerase sigma factor (sigma-70 family)
VWFAVGGSLSLVDSYNAFAELVRRHVHFVYSATQSRFRIGRNLCYNGNRAVGPTICEMPGFELNRSGLHSFLFGFAPRRVFNGELKMTDSQQLLAKYVQSGSEAAFRELVTRYVDLVYSTALRLVEGDTHRAEDVAQTVFADLARQARTLSTEVMLGGWLHRHTCFVAANTMRGERRRQSRERQAVEMNALQDHPEASLTLIAPILDDAINQLGEADRTAILLRFFEQRDFRSVGEVLGSNEDAARMRVTRALEKLHFLLKHRGVTTSATALGVSLSTNAVQAAPVGLAITISTAAAVAGTAAIHASTAIAATKAIAMTTLQKTLITATFIAAVGTGIYEARQAARLRGEVQTLQQQQAQVADQIMLLKSNNESLSNRVAQANRSPSLSSERLRELLRLRGEVGQLRRHQRELEQVAAVAQSKARGLPGQPTSVAALQSNMPAPFQVQLVLDEAGENTEPMTNNASGAGGETLHVQKAPLLDYTAISSATVTTSMSSGAAQIDIEFSEVGKELFAAVTKENINKRLAIVLNGQLFSAPVIRSEISGGKAQITGSFTEEEAREFAAKINDAISAK